RPADPEWVARIEALADADDPAETLLHRLALGAACDAATGAMHAGDRTVAERYARRALARWRSHLELRDCTTRVADLIATFGEGNGLAARIGLTADELSLLTSSSTEPRTA